MRSFYRRKSPQEEVKAALSRLERANANLAATEQELAQSEFRHKPWAKAILDRRETEQSAAIASLKDETARLAR